LTEKGRRSCRGESEQASRAGRICHPKWLATIAGTVYSRPRSGQLPRQQVGRSRRGDAVAGVAGGRGAAAGRRRDAHSHRPAACADARPRASRWLSNDRSPPGRQPAIMWSCSGTRPRSRPSATQAAAGVYGADVEATARGRALPSRGTVANRRTRWAPATFGAHRSTRRALALSPPRGFALSRGVVSTCASAVWPWDGGPSVIGGCSMSGEEAVRIHISTVILSASPSSPSSRRQVPSARWHPLRGPRHARPGGRHQPRHDRLGQGRHLFHWTAV
jgi:hypothetical protein